MTDMKQEDFGVYNTTQVAAAFSVSLETIRLWCHEFQRHLSHRANPGHRQKRAFTEEDLEVLSLVAELKAEGFTYPNIHAALDNGERGKVPIILHSEESDALILQETERRLALQIKQLESQLAAAKAENERLKEELSQMKSKLEATQQQSFKHEVRAELLNEQVEKLERRVKELLDERGRLEREIGSLESDLRHHSDEE